MAWYEQPTILSSIDQKSDYVFIDESGDIKDLKSIIKKIHNHSTVSVRDSNFLLTGIFIPSRNLKFLYGCFNELKIRYFNELFPFHAVDIDRNAEPYCNLGEKKQDFCKELSEIVTGFRYEIVGTAINKVNYVEKYYPEECEIDYRDIIWSIYSRHFKKLEDILNDRIKDAIVVVEEGSDPEIDHLILDCFNWLRTTKKIVRLKKLYFTKKGAVLYPAGTELADFTSKAIYGVYRNIEFVTVLRKIHNSPINNTKYLEFFDAPAQKRKNLPWKSMQGGGKCGLEYK